MKKIKMLFCLFVSNFLVFILVSCENIFNELEEEEHKHNEAVEGIIYNDLQIHSLELGNKYTGDATYIKAGDIDILIDAGSRKNSATVIKEYVDKYCSDNKLEYVIATHAHQDHIAGFVGSKAGNERNGILYQYKVDTLIEFALTDATSQLYEDYLDAVDYAVSRGAKRLSAGDCYENLNGATRSFKLTENISMDILYNYYYFNDASDTSGGENNYSVCLMFNYNDHHFMFTGDLEEEGEEKLVEYYDGSTKEKTLPKVDLFKAGHHGSKTSTNEKLLNLIKPDIVTVCACAGSTEYTADYKNVFPTQEFITRVAKYTDQVYVTSYFDEVEKTFKPLNGAIIVSCDGNAVAVAATNNTIKLKDQKWFNEMVYVDSSNRICPKKGSEDFYTQASSNVTSVVRRVWPN